MSVKGERSASNRPTHHAFLLLGHAEPICLRSYLDPTAGPSDFTRAGIVGPAGLPSFR